MLFFTIKNLCSHYSGRFILVEVTTNVLWPRFKRRDTTDTTRLYRHRIPHPLNPTLTTPTRKVQVISVDAGDGTLVETSVDASVVARVGSVVSREGVDESVGACARLRYLFNNKISMR